MLHKRLHSKCWCLALLGLSIPVVPFSSVGEGMRLTSPVASGNKTMKCEETEQVLQTVLMAYPGQASSLQGSHGADCDILAANDLGNGSGWQQSKQN